MLGPVHSMGSYDAVPDVVYLAHCRFKSGDIGGNGADAVGGAAQKMLSVLLVIKVRDEFALTVSDYGKATAAVIVAHHVSVIERRHAIQPRDEFFQCFLAVSHGEGFLSDQMDRVQQTS